MRNFLLRVIVYAIAIVVVAKLLPGIRVHNDVGSVVLVALIFGIVNALVKPIVKFLTCPLVLLTLGLFSLIINGLMLELTASLSKGALVVENLGWAIVGAILIAIISVILERILGVNDDDN
jgi:putative membrane protein